jgi:apolipoprotein N-acyltransferase
MSNSAPSLSLPMILRVVIGPALAGVMFATAFAPTEIRSMAMAGPLVLMLSLIDLSPAQARRAGFIFGAVAYGIGLSWFWNLFGWFSLALIGLLALYTMLFAWGNAVIQQQAWPAVAKVIVTACLWTGIEFARSELLPLNFPWMTIGHALDSRDSAELLSYIGVYGVGFIVMLLVSAIQQGRDAWPVLVALLGLALIPSNDDKPMPTMSVAAIQPATA